RRTQAQAGKITNNSAPEQSRKVYVYPQKQQGQKQSKIGELVNHISAPFRPPHGSKVCRARDRLGIQRQQKPKAEDEKRDQQQEAIHIHPLHGSSYTANMILPHSRKKVDSPYLHTNHTEPPTSLQTTLVSFPHPKEKG